MIVDALRQLAAGQPLTATPQPEAGVTYAEKIAKDEAPLDLTRPATELANQIRAFNPFPGATVQVGDTVIKCWQALPLAAATSLPHPPGDPGRRHSRRDHRLRQWQRPAGHRAAEARRPAPAGATVPAGHAAATGNALPDCRRLAGTAWRASQQCDAGLSQCVKRRLRH
jgi:hypothetical protein